MNYENYEQLHLFSTFRKNVIMWYPFKKNKKFLHLGSQAGVLTNYLCTKGEVYCVDSNLENNILNQQLNKEAKIYNYTSLQFINDFNEKVDYILIEGYLDEKENKKEILDKCLSLLNKDGQILILTDNKLGIRYFSGAKDKYVKEEFDNITQYNRLYTKKQWDALLELYSFKYKYYYPYPSYEFAEYIFSKTPSRSDINKEYLSFNSYRFSYFNEVTVLHQLIDSNYFEDFSNSFLIIIDGQSDIIYTKFARERKKEYQIYTNIVDNTEDKYVEKTPVYELGNKHIEQIYEYYNLFVKSNKNKKIHCCPLKIENNKLVFDFIDGMSLEKMVEKDVEKNDLLAIEEKLQIVDEIISIGQKCLFEESETFKNIFSDRDYSLLNNQECYDFCNIDLIFDNILVNDYYNVIDYEWVFHCKIPKTFILFRTIFHSPALGKLDKEKKNYLYQKYGIDQELYDLYLQMEIAFQNYVSDNKLEDMSTKFNCVTLKYKNSLDRIKIFQCNQGGYMQEKKIVDQLNYDVSFSVQKDKDIEIFLGKKAILKIEDIYLDNFKTTEFETNADLVKGNDYYFYNRPKIKIKNNQNELVRIKGMCYYYGESYVDNIIQLTINNEELVKQNTKMQNRIEKLRKHLFVKVIEKIGE